ncbi:MAG: HD domain-containing protein [Candidatus Harrisonbacteria bacterium]|nr:HD domain-containing protein [Candidatus Harrisonbacteria bacterium]
MNSLIPKEILAIGDVLQKAGYKAYLVGGCVRDILIGREPKDWDITTDAKPEEIQKIFATFAGGTVEDPSTVYENNFGTVLIKLGSQTNADDTQTNAENPRQRESALNVVEVTTFRLEGKYTDKRHPDEVKFAKTVEEDLSRRDFTINAIALGLSQGEPSTRATRSGNKLLVPELVEGQLIDPYGGQTDLKKKIIRTVGNPDERFTEDALRLMRAVRFAAQLGFVIEKETAAAIKKHAGLLEMISKERVRDELAKLLMTDNAVRGMEDMRAFGLLRYVLPELQDGVSVGQNKHHIYTVYEHNLRSLAYAVQKNFPLDLRITALLHDVGKPATKHGEGESCTFYGHQVVGERIAMTMLDRLHFPRPLIEKVALLIREHMFVYDPESVTLAGVRRIVRRVGRENVNDLMLVREADRIGSGVPKAQPYRLRYLKAMIEKVQKDPIHPKMLVLKGDDVMRILHIAGVERRCGAGKTRARVGRALRKRT